MGHPAAIAVGCIGLDAGATPRLRTAVVIQHAKE